MPFIELKKKNLIDECTFSSGSLSVPHAMFSQRTSKRKVRIYVDEENKLIGLEPSEEGYSVFPTSSSKNVFRIRITVLKNFLENKRYPFEWNERHKMFIIKYGE